ncbi:MAG: Ig domain-containing protein, partial [Oscillospiraceae bacterium]|nr:Ig domain-containing protein [Oscillospiraceae bacterium]
MEHKICEFCGTEFLPESTHCPLCNRAVPSAIVEDVFLDEIAEQESAPAEKKHSTGGKFLAKQAKPAKTATADNPYCIPKGAMIAICVTLGVLVIFGALFAFYNIGYFVEPISLLALAGRNEPVITEPAEQETPAVSQKPTEDLYTNEEDYQAPAEDDKPAFIACEAITLGTPSITFDEAEQFYNMTVTLEPIDCTEDVTFSSTDESIASVNANGKIVAISPGTAEIIAVCGGQTASCLVTCDFALAAGEEEPEEIIPPELNNVDMTFFSPGEQFALVVKNIPDNTPVTYTSSKPNIAAVSSTGVVTAMGSGDATVTASFKVGEETMTLECIVRCNLDGSAETVATPGEANCTTSHSDVTMSILGEYFKISLFDANGKKIPDIVWKSSDTS